METSALRRNLPGAAVFACTLVVRLSATWQLAHSPYGAPTTGDMRFYAEWARRIADGQLTDFHAFYGQPLYAYLLGGLFSLVGFWPAVVAVLQDVLDAATAVLILQIARLAFAGTPRSATVVGCLAAIGWAFFVPSIAYSGLLIPASSTVFAWWFCVWWLLARSSDAGIGEWLCIAVFVGVMATMSATILFVLPLLAARAITDRSVAAAVVLLAGVAIGIAPAWLHNAIAARDPVFISAHSGVNFWIGNNPEANGYPRVPRGLPSEQAALLEQSIKIAEAAAGTPLPRSAVSEFWSSKASAYIHSQPAQWGRLIAAKACNFWNAFEYDDLSSVTAFRDAGIVPPGVSFGLIAALGFPGLLLTLASARPRSIAFAVLLQMVALLPVFVNERYRLPAAPGLLLLSALFLRELWDAVARLAWSRVAVATLLVTVSVWLVTISRADSSLRSLNDYKTARRHILAGEHALGEVRMRQALRAMLGAQDLAPAAANGFAEIANEQMQNGDRSGALKTIDAALRINPTDERLRREQQRISATPAGER